MSDTLTDLTLGLLRERERMLEMEFAEARIEADKLVAVADARLSEVRDLIERLSTRKRRTKKDAAATATAGLSSPPADPEGQLV